MPRFELADGTRATGMAGCGTWAEEIVVPQAAAIVIDDDVPFEYAALLGCGIPTGVGASGTIYFSSDIENAIYKVARK